jgi:hypothetical protein
MPFLLLVFFLAINSCLFSQSTDAGKYHFEVIHNEATDQFFRAGKAWLGADGASAIDLGKDKLLWLFSDSFIAKDTTYSRTNSIMVRNSIAIQDGYTVSGSSPRFYWDTTGRLPRDFFYKPGNNWFWTGHGIMVKDKLLVFLMNVQAINTGLGFEVSGWTAVLVENPLEDPSTWKMNYFDGGETFGLIAGSAAVLKDDRFVYAYGAVEPATHEVYLLRWEIRNVYKGNLSGPDWFIDGQWRKRTSKFPLPKPLFIGGTEFSVHYDAGIKKYVQVQSFGFGEASIGIRIADSLNGTWSEPIMVYKPSYNGAKQPFMYAAKAHPELIGEGLYITYNVNSFDFNELLANPSLYYPRFIRLLISINEEH